MLPFIGRTAGPPALDTGRHGAAVERQFAAAGSLAPADGRAIEQIGDARSSLALRNLRGLVILIVLAFHSVLPYLWSVSSSAVPFDHPPYGWRAFPIVDSHRWFGFDLFCA